MTAPTPKFSYPSKTAYYDAWPDMEPDKSSGTAAGQVDTHSTTGHWWPDDGGRQWLIALNYVAGSPMFALDGGRVGNLVATNVGPDGGTGEVHVLATYVSEEEVDEHVHKHGRTYEDAAAFGRDYSRFKPGRAAGPTTYSPEEADAYRAGFEADSHTVATALLSQLVAGTDIGEFLLDAIRRAEEQIAPGYGLLDNRPGSWEAALFAPIINRDV